MNKRIVVTENELLDELKRLRAPDGPPNAMTVRELAAAAGLGMTAVRAYLLKMERAGRLQTWRVERTDTKGRSVPIPAYTIIPAKKETRRA